ncbi:MAG: helix-turn-helix domain-containing protein [Hyphomicrobium sp.]|uniref:winged helix-turn-helix transcriptional regulator n=1 Tax=Hyphomicrobium sp. TaxID=82 RepID=UPI0039E6A32B
MHHKSFANLSCPIARSLEHVGEWWSILILRDAFRGLTRFDEFQKNLEIAPNMLARRLSALTESGLLERRLYSEKPARYEYLLTERGRDFRPVMLTLLAWGNKHFFPEGPSVALVDTKTGLHADPIVIDRISGRPILGLDFKSVPLKGKRTASKHRKADVNSRSAKPQSIRAATKIKLGAKGR